MNKGDGFLNETSQVFGRSCLSGTMLGQALNSEPVMGRCSQANQLLRHQIDACSVSSPSSGR